MQLKRTTQKGSLLANCNYTVIILEWIRLCRTIFTFDSTKKQTNFTHFIDSQIQTMHWVSGKKLNMNFHTKGQIYAYVWREFRSVLFVLGFLENMLAAANLPLVSITPERQPEKGPKTHLESGWILNGKSQDILFGYRQASPPLSLYLDSRGESIWGKKEKVIWWRLCKKDGALVKSDSILSSANWKRKYYALNHRSPQANLDQSTIFPSVSVLEWVKSMEKIGHPLSVI